MTTNDPLNPYPGNLKRHEVKTEPKPEDIRRFRLRVVEEVHDVENTGYLFSCSKCGWWIESGASELNFCPGCGNPIKR